MIVKLFAPVPPPRPPSTPEIGAVFAGTMFRFCIKITNDYRYKGTFLC